VGKTYDLIRFTEQTVSRPNATNIKFARPKS